MLAAIEDKDVVVPVHANAADFLECPAGREFCPVLYWFVGVCAATNGSHARAPLFVASRKACHEAKGWASIGCRLCSLNSLLAQSRYIETFAVCPLSGAKRTLLGERVMSACDPKQTSGGRLCCDAQNSPDRYAALC